MRENRLRDEIEQTDNMARIKSLSQSKIERMSEEEKNEWKMTISWFLLTDTIKKKIRLEIQSRMKIIDIATIFLSGIGLTMNCLQSLFYLHFEMSLYL